MAFDNDTKITIRGDSASAQLAFRQVGESATRMGGTLKAATSGIGTSLVGLTAQATTLFGVIAGAGFVVAAKNAIDYQDAVSDSAQITGLSTESFSSMAYAAKFGNVETELLSKAIVKLNASMVDVTRGEPKLQALFGKTLKIDVRDASGAMRAADEVMMDIAERISQLDDGARKTALAIELFGEKAGPQLIPFLNQGRSGITALREEAQKLGLVVSTETAESAAKLNDDLDRLRAASQGASNQFAQQLVPGLARTAEFFVQATKDTNLWTGALITLGKVISDIAPDVLGLSDAAVARNNYAEAKAEIQRLELVLIGLENTLKADPGNQAAQRRFDKLTQKANDLRAELLRLSAALARAESGAKDVEGGRGNVNPARVPGASIAAPELSSKATPMPSRGGEWGNVLEQQKKAYADGMALQNNFTEWGLQEESRYWQGILARRDISVDERKAVESKYLSAEAGIRKEASAARLAEVQVQIELARDNYAQREDLAKQYTAKIGDMFGLGSKQYAEALKSQLAVEREHRDKLRAIKQLHLQDEAADMEQLIVEREAQAVLEVELGLRTKESLLEVQRQGAASRLQIEMDLLSAEQAAWAVGTLEYEQYEARKAAAKRKAKSLDANQGREKDKLEAEPALNIMKTGETAFGASIDAIVAKGRSAGAELGKIWRSAGLEMINELTTKPLMAWMAGWIRKLALNVGFLATQNSSEAARATLSIATEQSIGIASIAVSAARAAAGAYAALASIPYLAPLLPPLPPHL